MKNNIVRAFVIGLAITGFGATTVSAHSASKAKMAITTTANPDAPSPMCAPSDPSACGLH